MNGLAEADYLRSADDVAEGFEVGITGTFIYRRDGIYVSASPLTECLRWDVLSVSRDRAS
jgi:hypothetical protein